MKTKYYFVKENSGQNIGVVTHNGDEIDFKSRLLIALGQHFDSDIKIDVMPEIDEYGVEKDFSVIDEDNTSLIVTIARTWIY